jgi:hypothetical protein
VTEQLGADPFADAGRPSLRSWLASSGTLLTLVAVILLPLGLMVILLGWYGAAHTPYLFEQVPYLISGGLAGLGLMLAGGLLYFGSWIARSSATAQASNDELIGLLLDIREELANRPDEVAAPTQRTRRAASNGSLVATATGSMMHRPDCSVVAGKSGLKKVGPDSGLRPCGICDPLSAGSTVPA